MDFRQQKIYTITDRWLLGRKNYHENVLADMSEQRKANTPKLFSLFGSRIFVCGFAPA
jgi:hypothetical protein